MTDLAGADATEQAALVRAGEVSAAELVDAAIERAERRNPALNAIIHPRFERARAEAAVAPDGPFRGVPIVVKDLDGPLAGEPYHLGNRLLRAVGHVADHDSWLNARLRAAGCVVIGKTNAPELGLLPTTEPAAYGPTRNPWDPTRSPGGSSGGTAAAVGAGIVPLGHAGDGGGSIRIPASMCNLFGLKPTRGRVSLGPDEGQVWDGLVVRHVLTRSVRDSAAILDVIAGPMPGDPYSAAPPPRSFLDGLEAPTRPLRIGLRIHAPAAASEVDPACVAAAEGTARMLEALGHTVELASPPALDEGELLSTYLVIAATAVAHDLTRIGAIAGRTVQADDVEALTWSYAELAADFSAADHAAALDSAHAWSRRVAEWWSPANGTRGFDLLVTPTLAALPPPIGTIDGNHPDPGATLTAATPFAAFTLPFNITGQPAMSVPLAMANGLPIGTQVVAATGDEAVLLALAAQLEAAHPWSDRLPPI
jgi:amidase